MLAGRRSAHRRPSRFRFLDRYLALLVGRRRGPQRRRVGLRRERGARVLRRRAARPRRHEPLGLWRRRQVLGADMDGQHRDVVSPHRRQERRGDAAAHDDAWRGRLSQAHAVHPRPRRGVRVGPVAVEPGRPREPISAISYRRVGWTWWIPRDTALR